MLESASPRSTALTTTVAPFVDVESLRVVVVLAWPPDPTSVTTTSTTVPGSTDTTGPSDTAVDESSSTTEPEG